MSEKLKSYEDLERLLDGQSEILRLIAEGVAIEYISTHIVRWVESYTNGDMHASILFMDESGEHLLHGAAPSLPLEYNKAINSIRIGPNVGSCGTAAYTRQPVIVEDIENDPLWKDFKDLALKFSLRSCWSTPLISKNGAVLGTFALYTQNVSRPTLADIHLVNLVSRTAVLALEFHALEKEMKRLKAVS